MRLRFHLLAGLLALLALTATAVEGLWMATQRAEMGTRTAVAASALTNGPSTPDCPAEMVHTHLSCPAGGNPDAPQCPSMPLGMASSCVGAVALPVESVPCSKPSLKVGPPLRFPDQTRDLLLAVAFLRPPIA